MRKKWTKEEEIFLEKNYNKLSNKEIGNILERSVSSIQNKAERLGVKLKKIKKNENYFQKIDSKEKAYWLGFIFADGYITFNSIKRNYSLGLELALRDIKHLQNFAKAINFDGNIYTRKRANNNPNFKREFYDIAVLRIHSKPLVLDLIKLGIEVNKSKKESKIFSCIPDEYKFAFLIGWYDGDGHTYVDDEYIRSRSKIAVDSSDYSFIKQVQKYLQKFNIEANINITKTNEKNRQNLYRITVHKNNSKKILLEKILKNKELPLLERKLEKNITLLNAL